MITLTQPAPPSIALNASVQWEETPCLLCGGGRCSLVLRAPDNLAGSGQRFSVIQCRDCDLCFTNPRPSAASISRFYPAGYGPYHSHHSRPVNLWRRLRGVPARWMPRLLPAPGPSGGRLLDFGCGNGAFLDEMHRCGWQVAGIDSAAAPIEHIRRELGLPALAGTLPHPELPTARFDLITMWQSLEHVHAPLEVLREARRLLAPGGRLVAAVPNIDSLAFRWLGASWYGLDLPRHLTHFAPATLRRMLERAGFRVGPVRMMRRSAWLRRSARLACQNPAAPRWHRWLKTPLISRLAAGYACLTGQSDCMVVVAGR